MTFFAYLRLSLLPFLAPQPALCRSAATAHDTSEVEGTADVRLGSGTRIVCQKLKFAISDLTWILGRTSAKLLLEGDWPWNGVWLTALP
ncbi:MAG: hypothetical protein ACR2PF_14945, partial [Rhizobiaceae bacterium]